MPTLDDLQRRVRASTGIDATASLVQDELRRRLAGRLQADIARQNRAAQAQLLRESFGNQAGTILSQRSDLRNAILSGSPEALRAVIEDENRERAALGLPPRQPPQALERFIGQFEARPPGQRIPAGLTEGLAQISQAQRFGRTLAEQQGFDEAARQAARQAAIEAMIARSEAASNFGLGAQRTAEAFATGLSALPRALGELAQARLFREQAADIPATREARIKEMESKAAQQRALEAVFAASLGRVQQGQLAPPGFTPTPVLRPQPFINVDPGQVVFDPNTGQQVFQSPVPPPSRVGSDLDQALADIASGRDGEQPAQAIDQGQPQPGDIPEEAVNLLRRNPSQKARQQFDAVFGPGAAARVLGNDAGR